MIQIDTCTSYEGSYHCIHTVYDLFLPLHQSCSSTRGNIRLAQKFGSDNEKVGYTRIASYYYIMLAIKKASLPLSFLNCKHFTYLYILVTKLHV